MNAMLKLLTPLVVLLTACSSDPEPPRMTAEELMDPENCKDCHQRQYREWKSSMHAYAADDPVFLAMNERGQEETDGELGDFCIQCHAPMAVLTGATDDGLNVRELPQHLKGVTCYFCHSVEGLGSEPHNNPLEVRTDNTTMYGSFADPAPSAPHAAGYSRFLDSDRRESADMCGSCHDIMTPNGVHLERTYHEWQNSVFARESFKSCAGGCHMPGRDDTAVSGPRAPTDVRTRRVREHLWPGVDTALTPFPEDEPELMEAQRLAILKELRDTVNITELCVHPSELGALLRLVNEAGGSGHNWPSGATQDRRAWIEVRAFKDGEVIFESGVVQEGEAVVDVQARDPQMVVYRDEVFGAEGQPVHMFWDAAPSEQYPTGYESYLLPAMQDILTPHYKDEFYDLPEMPDRVEIVFYIRALGIDVLEDLYDGGHLSPDDHSPIPTFPLEGTRVVWTPDQAGFDGCIVEPYSVGEQIDACAYRRFFGDPACEDP